MGSPTGLLLQHQQSDSAVSKTVTYHHHDQLEQHDLHEVACRLEVHLKALEHERKKIDAFKRELPFCMQLLHDAIEASKEQLAVCCALSHKQPQGLVSRSFDNRDPNIQSASERSVLEEFVCVKKQTDSFYTDSSEGEPVEKRVSTHANGDTFNSMKIWNPRAEVSSHNQERCQSVILSDERSSRYMQEQNFSSSSKPVFHSKQKSGGAFLPFSRDKRLVQPTPRPGAVNPTDLAIVCCDSENIPSPAFGNPGTTFDPPRAKSRGSVQQQVRETLLRELPTRSKSRDSVKQQPKETLVEENKVKIDSSNVSQPARKARRSWSPELHRRFVDALQNLGGAQATPKQIRELMNVEGLTNDEVKSHLQKYRLHTRRLGPYPTPSPHASQVVFPGGLQVPSEHAVHAAVQQAPASFNFSRQPESCQTSLSREIVTQLDSSGRLPSRSSLRCGKQSAVAHSQSSWKGPLQLIGHSSAGIYGSGDAGREESVGEAVKSEDSGWKGQHPGLRLNEVDESEDQSVSGSQSRCIGEDETEHDDSEGLESRETTSLKL